MLDGVTPFPAEFAARYRELGYWEDRPLFDGFTAALAAYADRVALADKAGPVTYRQLDERSEHLARVLLDLGLRPLDRIIVQLPNTAAFAYLHFALQRIGAVPVLALPGHRKWEITQFAEISGATALAVPATARGFDFTAMAADIMTDRPDLRLCLVQGMNDGPNEAGFVRLEDLLEREPRTSREALGEIRIDPADPALFLLPLPGPGPRRADVRLCRAAPRPVAQPGGARHVPARIRDRHVQAAGTARVLRHAAPVRIRQGLQEGPGGPPSRAKGPRPRLD